MNKKLVFITVILLTAVFLNLSWKNQNYIIHNYDPIEDEPLSTANSIGLIWNITWADAVMVEGRDIVLDQDQNIYITGYISRLGGGVRDIFLQKYNQYGILEWNVSWGWNQESTSIGITIDNSNNIYLSGWARNSSTSVYDIVIVKYERNSGSQIWNRTYGVSDYSLTAFDIDLDNSGNIYVCGSKFPRGGGYYNATILKYDNSGNFQWYREWGGSETDIANAIVVDDDDNIYITGLTRSYGYYGVSDFFLLKYDTLGVLQKNVTWGGSNPDEAYSITTDSQGNVFIVGNTMSYSLGAEPDVAIVKYNNLGVREWNTTWSSIYREYPHDIILDSNDNIYITGGLDYWEPTHLLFIKFDKNGNLIMNFTGSKEGEIGYGITLDNSESILICGVDLYYLKLWKFSQLPVNFTLSSDAGNPDYDGDFNLNWTSSSNADNYTVFYYDQYITEINGSLSELASEISNLSHPISGLSNGDHYFKAVAYNAAGNISSNCLHVVVLHPPESFTLYTNAEDPEIDKIFNLYWDTSPWVNNYSVYQYQNYITTINTSVNLIESGLETDIYSPDILVDGDYYFIIVAFNSAGNTTSNCIYVRIGEYPRQGGGGDLPWSVQAVLYGSLSAVAGICIRIVYGYLKKKKIVKKPSES
ncbi:MAG: SBBP repeat-containing protein [Promethearchaeota archaeon]